MDHGGGRGGGGEEKKKKKTEMAERYLKLSVGDEGYKMVTEGNGQKRIGTSN